MASSTTNYHAKYFAYELTRTGGQGLDRITQSLFNASVDLNPHQVEAALFALRSPLSRGVLLADEVGLGKTIEAGLVLCQFWAERKRALMVICPAALRKQWQIELEEKFNLSGYSSKISVLEDLKGKSGYIFLNRLEINSLDREEYLLFTGFTEDGRNVSHDILTQFFKLDGEVGSLNFITDDAKLRLQADMQRFAEAKLHESMGENNKLFLVQNWNAGSRIATKSITNSSIKNVTACKSIRRVRIMTWCTSTAIMGLPTRRNLWNPKAASPSF